MCVGLRGGEVRRAAFEAAARGAQLARRNGAHHLSELRGMYRCYDHTVDAYLVPAPTARRCRDPMLTRYFEYVSCLPDAELLTHSTSPGFEQARSLTATLTLTLTVPVTVTVTLTPTLTVTLTLTPTLTLNLTLTLTLT